MSILKIIILNIISDTIFFQKIRPLIKMVLYKQPTTIEAQYVAKTVGEWL